MEATNVTTPSAKLAKLAFILQFCCPLEVVVVVSVDPKESVAVTDTVPYASPLPAICTAEEVIALMNDPLLGLVRETETTVSLFTRTVLLAVFPAASLNVARILTDPSV